MGLLRNHNYQHLPTVLRSEPHSIRDRAFLDATAPKTTRTAQSLFTPSKIRPAPHGASSASGHSHLMDDGVLTGSTGGSDTDGC